MRTKKMSISPNITIEIKLTSEQIKEAIAYWLTKAQEVECKAEDVELPIDSRCEGYGIYEYQVHSVSAIASVKQIKKQKNYRDGSGAG